VPPVCQDAAFPRRQPSCQPARLMARVTRAKGATPAGATVALDASRCAFAATVSIAHHELIRAARAVLSPRE
jgi:hypothetical protein